MSETQRDATHTLRTGPRGFHGEGDGRRGAATILLGAGWLQLREAADQVGGRIIRCWWGRTMTHEQSPIQPPDVPSPPGPDESLNNMDLQVGRRGNDILIGLGGNDVDIGDDGSDIYIGVPGADVQFGGRGSDFRSGPPGMAATFIDRPGWGRARDRPHRPGSGQCRAAAPDQPDKQLSLRPPSVNISGPRLLHDRARRRPESRLRVSSAFFVRSSGSLPDDPPVRGGVCLLPGSDRRRDCLRRSDGGQPSVRGGDAGPGGGPERKRGADHPIVTDPGCAGARGTATRPGPRARCRTERRSCRELVPGQAPEPALSMNEPSMRRRRRRRGPGGWSSTIADSVPVTGDRFHSLAAVSSSRWAGRAQPDPSPAPPRPTGHRVRVHE